jgi:hypothetical protein
MGLDRLIRLAVSTANAQTADVQGKVTFQRVKKNPDGSVKQDGRGNKEYESGVPIDAFIEDEQRPIRTEDGTKRQVNSKVTFFTSMEVDSEDKITLPNGKSGPILRIKALLDKAGDPYMTEVWLGTNVGVRRS